MGIYTDAIQKLYVAYFNRPADVAGLQYWEGVVTAAKGNTSAVSAAFSASAEYKAAYAGMDEYHVVAQVYQNLFGHSPDLAGLNFWGQALIGKAMTVDNVVTQIAGGAQGTDLTAYNSKVAAAGAFTVALDTPEKILAYSGDKANGVGKSFIAGVTDDASLKAAIATAAMAATTQAVIDNGPQPVGATFTLTAGLDTFSGTSGNDVFNVYTINPTSGAAATNLSAFDSIDGSAGKDTLNIQLDATSGNTLTGTVKNVETINITAAAATAVDASIFQGATLVNQIGTAGAVTNLGNGATAGYQGVTIAGAQTVGAAGATAGVSFNGVADSASVAISGTPGLNTVNVSGTRVHVGGGTVAALTLGVTAGKDQQSITINSNQKLTLTVTEDATTAAGKQITSIDASASTGAIASFTGDADLLTLKTGSAGDTVTLGSLTAVATSTAAAKNATVTTGAGNDAITVTTTGTGLTSVDAGTGDDSITITKVTGNGLSVQAGDGNDTVTLLAAGGKLETTDIVNGGAGTDTIAMAGAATRAAGDYIVFNKMVTGFETIKFTGAIAEAALDASQLGANYTTIDLNAGGLVTKVGTQALVGNGAITATADGYIAADTYAGTLAITEKVTGNVTANADVLNLSVKASGGSTGANVAATVLGDVQTATVSLTNTVDSTTTPTVDRIASVIVDTGATGGDAFLKSLTLTGNGSANVTNGAGTALTSVDASALGGTLVFGTGATQGLTYSTSNTKAETIKVGSGIDHITIAAGSTYGTVGSSSIDSITGLSLVRTTAGTALATTSDTLAVTGVATTVTKFTTTQTDLDLALTDAAAATGADLVFVMGGDTYIYHDGGTAGLLDSGDIVVKLVGITDTNAVIVALGGTPV